MARWRAQNKMDVNVDDERRNVTNAAFSRARLDRCSCLFRRATGVHLGACLYCCGGDEGSRATPFFVCFCFGVGCGLPSISTRHRRDCSFCAENTKHTQQGGIENGQRTARAMSCELFMLARWPPVPAIHRTSAKVGRLLLVCLVPWLLCSTPCLSTARAVNGVAAAAPVPVHPDFHFHFQSVSPRGRGAKRSQGRRRGISQCDRSRDLSRKPSAVIEWLKMVGLHQKRAQYMHLVSYIRAHSSSSAGYPQQYILASTARVDGGGPRIHKHVCSRCRHRRR